jgi:thioredoxin-dependent peroxiredoxin
MLIDLDIFYIKQDRNLNYNWWVLLGNLTNMGGMMEERKGIITAGGKGVTLLGNPIKVGDIAPDAIVVDNDMQTVHLDEFHGKVLVLASVPSLDTEVCNLETRHFNSEAAKLSPDVQILTISMDLPFAQKRWCGTAGVERVKTLSDHREASFGHAYGVLIKESRLLARTVFVVDKDSIVRYVQMVPELGQEPQYEPVLDTVNKLTQNQ